MKYDIVAAFIAVNTLINCFLGAAARAEDPMTSLEQLVKEAVANNPELAFYRAEIAAAKGEHLAAGALSNPELGVEVGRKRAEERGGGLIGEGTAWSVSVSQAFEFPGRLSLRKAIANGQIELAEVGLEHFKASLGVRVQVLGYSLFVAQERARTAQAVADRSSELIKVLVQRDPAGVAPLLETRIIEASVIRLNQKSTEALHEALTALFELNQLRGKPVSDTMTISALRLDFGNLPEEEALIRSALEKNFELRMRRVELAQQGFRVDLSKNQRYPSFTVSPFYAEERAGEREQTVGLGVTVPLPVWNQNAGEIEANQARKAQAETALVVAQRQVEREVRERSRTYGLRLKEMARWRPDAVEELRAAAEMGDRHYRLGSLPVSTYLELQEQYLEALEAILTTQRQTLEDLSELELMTGMTLRQRAKAAGVK